MKQKLHLKIVMQLSLLAVTFASCGGESKEEPVNSSNPLIGTWEQKTYYTCSHDQKRTQVYVFKKDGTGSHYFTHPNGEICTTESNSACKWSNTPTEIHLVYNSYATMWYYTVTSNTLHLIDKNGDDYGVYVRK